MSTKPREFYGKFRSWGTDSCSKCEEGRITLFISNDKCISCDPESYKTRGIMPNDSQENKVNWEKVWNSYDTARLCPNEGPRKLIQQLVEKSLKGEL